MIFPQESEDLRAKSRDLIIYEGNGLGKEVVFLSGGENLRKEFREGEEFLYGNPRRGFQ